MQQEHQFTLKIVLGMILGIVLGLLWQFLPFSHAVSVVITQTIAGTIGSMFIRLLKMLVVPIVLVSLVCGVCHLGEVSRLGSMAIKAIGLYLLTTAVAISLALFVASFFEAGAGMKLATSLTYSAPASVSPAQVVLNLIPTNPFQALVEGKMMQIIVFSLLVGIAIVACGDKANPVADFFKSSNEVMMKLIMMIMSLAPYGVFFLLLSLFSRLDFSAIGQLIEYFMIVVAVLLLQLVLVYGGLLWAVCRESIASFLKKMSPALLFAFSTSSSSATIPVTLKTVKERLGINHSISAFVIPLGATLNMDGTAIMQGVATVFIAHAYGVPLTLGSYVTVIVMATLASVGTAGVPGVGLLTLAMVLEQVGLPVSGIALIIGVDRLLDMMRTAVNVSGDAMVASLIARMSPVE